MNNNLLALGIPTFNRPDFAIKLIGDVINLNVYDEIIVSCNSKEPIIESFINDLGSDTKVIYNLQDENVGLSRNYGDIIAISKCQYIHIISDEDSVDHQNLKNLYQFIRRAKNQYGVMCLSVVDEYGNIYKDTSTQINHRIKNICSDTGHIGSAVINIKHWNKNSISMFNKYAEREGNIYPTTAAAIIAYSSKPKIAYFPKHIVRMGPKHKKSEITGHRIYGFSSRGFQLMSLIDLVLDSNFSRGIKTIIYMVYFFSSHAFIDSYRKFNESPYSSCYQCLISKDFSSVAKLALLFAIILFYLIRTYRFLRSLIVYLLKTFTK